MIIVYQSFLHTGDEYEYAKQANQNGYFGFRSLFSIFLYNLESCDGQAYFSRRFIRQPEK